MEQHPVPQHISAYQFRLIGDMTLKQFGLLTGPCLLALLCYALPIPGLFKWPLIVFLVFIGILMAFFPIEERSLDRWLIAFIKAIYSPTQFIWKKQPKKPEILAAPPVAKAPPKATPPPDQVQLGQYLQTLPQPKTPLEKQEEAVLQKIGELLRGVQVSKVTPAPPPVAPEIPPSPPVKKIVVPPTPPVAPPPTEKITPPTMPTMAPRPPVAKPVFRQPKPIKRQPAVAATISPGLPFPQTPRSPNLLVGMVLDPQGRIIEGAILEIRDSKGIPVRALKTNKLGQFRIVTPLANDTYEVETEKPGYTFDIIRVTAKGEPVPPIEIRSKEAKATNTTSFE